MTLYKFFAKDAWLKDPFKQVNGMFNMNISTKDAWLKNPYKQGKKWLAGCSTIAVVLAIVELLYHKFYDVPMFDDWLCFALPIFFFVNGLIGWFWGFYFTPSKPRWMSIVNLNRHLFSKSGWSMLVAALVVTIVIIGLLSLLILLIKSSLPDQEVVESDVFDEKSSFWFVIRHFMDAGNITSERNSDWAYALFCAFIGIFILSGFTVSSFVNIISKKSDNWKKGLIHYNRTFDNYVVIIGCNEQTANLVRNSLNKTIDNKKVRFVLIQTRQDVEKAREALELKLNAEEEKWVVFYSGERTSKEDIAALHLEKALEVFVLGEDIHIENEKDHDTYNINCLQLISEYIKPFKKINAGENNLRCHVNLEYQSTYAVFKSINLYKVNKRLEFLPFNVNEIWAKKVLVDNCAVVPAENGTRRVEYYLPLDYYGINESTTRTVHLFIIGMNQMGATLATQAALLAHYPNFIKDSKYRTTITFIDDNAIKEGEFYRGRYAQLFALCRYRTMTAGEVVCRDAVEWIDPIRDANADFEYRHTFKESNFLDIQWEFIQGNVASDGIKEYMKEVACDSDKECTIAICYTDPQKSVAAAVYLPEKLLKKVNQVLVYQPNKFELVNMASSSDLEWKRYEKLRPFGMIEDCYTSNMFEDVGPRLAQGMFLDDTLLVNLLDNIDISNIDEHIRELKRHWSELDMSNRLSNINMIDSIATKIRSLGCVSEKVLEDLNFTGKSRYLRTYSDGQDKEIQTLLKEHLDSLSQTEHTRWLTERLIIGYRPVNAKEYEEIQILRDDKISFGNKKDYFENKYKALLDICANEVLYKNDPYLVRNNQSNDEKFVTNIPQLKNAKSLILSRLALRERKHSVRSFYENKYDEDGLTRRILQKMRFVDLDDKGMKFWICSEAVSVGLWNEVMRDGKRGENPKLPKTGVSKEDAENFIRILNNKTGLYFRLPTMEEWSAAAIIESKEICPKSNDRKSNKPTGAKKVCNAENGRKLLAVKKRGYRGKNDLYHMAGNVWEWTSTSLQYGETTERSFYYCGGSYKYGKVECEIQRPKNKQEEKKDDNKQSGEGQENNNWYNYGLSDFRSEDLGFRLVLSHDFEQISLIDKMANPKNVEIASVIDELFKDTIGLNEDNNKLKVIGWMVNITKIPDNHRYCMGIEGKIPEESPAHFVKLRAKGLFVGSYLVTQKLWKIVMGGNPSSHKGDNNPVENVSYEDIQKFLEKLNGNLKQSNFYKDNFDDFKGWKFRLPTETEWEFIAKGGANYRSDVPSSCTADDFSKSYHKYSGTDENDNCDEVAWHYKLTKTTHQVGKKKGCLVVDQNTIDEKREKERNEGNHKSKDEFLKQFMVYDMCGNVWEWCEDDYDADAYTKVIKYDENGKATIEILDAKSTAHNTPRYVGIFYPKEKNFVHSVRGGSFKCLPEECRVTRVSRRLSDQRFDDLGFRLVFAECDFIEEIRKANKKLDAQKKRENNKKRKVKESENEQDKE